MRHIKIIAVDEDTGEIIDQTSELAGEGDDYINLLIEDQPDAACITLYLRKGG